MTPPGPDRCHRDRTGHFRTLPQTPVRGGLLCVTPPKTTSRASDKPILRFPERNDEDTFWTRADETKPASVKNKFKSEDMTRVRKHKEILWTEVAKNDPTSLVDRWFRDHIKAERWERIAGDLPEGGKCSPKHKWVLMTENAKSLTTCFQPVTRRRFGQRTRVPSS